LPSTVPIDAAGPSVARGATLAPSGPIAVAPVSGGGSSAGAVSAAGGVEANRRTRWWGELLLVVWLCWVYDMINNLAPLRLGLALSHARAILHLEQTLHLNPERALDSWLAGHHTLGLILSLYYDNAHFIVTLGLLGWLWWRRPDIYRPLRNTLVIVNLLGFAVFWLYPVAPPRMLKGFTDVVAASHTFGSWHTGALASQANQLAAMPSLHIAWAVWCTIVVWRLSSARLLRGLAAVYPCVTAVAVLATGNHFLLDILGGLLVIAIAALIAPGLAGIATRMKAVAARLNGRRAGLSAKSGRAAYRVSQTCYEVQDKVE
jgi:hypothetical protein